MNWKSSALLSGAALLAGYFVTAPASNLPGSLLPAQPEEASTPASAGSDIADQADRLQARLRQETLFRTPSRNLFRFGERPVARPPAARPRAQAAVTDTADPIPLAPIQPPFTLSGMAIDGDVRTAILSAPSDIFLVRAGDEVLGYRVSTVENEAVTLVNADGATFTLQLRK